MIRHWLTGTLWLGLGACASKAPPPTTATPSPVEICPEGKTPGPGGGCRDKAPAPAASAATSAAPERKFTVFERPAQGGDLGSLVGSWIGEDSDGSASYELQISGDGRYTQTITTLNPASGRAPGSCYQSGTVRLEGSRVVWFYEQNSCNTDYEGREDPDELLEQSRRHFVISMSSYQIHYSRAR
jgi:hypothetical protein